MRQLLLLRHGKAADALAGQPDFHRPLTARGMRAAEDAGQQLRSRGIQPDRLLSSPAQRALSTARLAAQGLGMPASAVAPIASIYNASAVELLEVLQSSGGDADCLLLVGHHPGLPWLANELVSGEGVAELATAGLHGLELDIDAWEELAPGCATLAFSLRGLG